MPTSNKLPPTMRAVLQTDKHGQTLELMTMPTPTADTSVGEHLIQVHATAPCKDELTWWATPNLTLDANKEFVPCFDLAGVVVSGPADSAFQAGEAVFTRTSFARTGNAREYTIAVASEMAHKPEKLTWEEAASVPLSAFTAYQALFEHGGLAEGALQGSVDAKAENAKKTVLITGAAGGAGCWVVQLAKGAGVREIVGVCGTSNTAFARELGATDVIDYRSSNVQEWAETNRADLIVDCVGGDTLTQCWLAVKDGGTLVSINMPPDVARPRYRCAQNVKSMFFIMEPRSAQLEMVGNLLEDGRCRAVVDSVYSLEDFQKAFDKVEGGHARGKVIIKVVD